MLHINLESTPPSTTTLFRKSVLFWMRPLSLLLISGVLALLQWYVPASAQEHVAVVGLTCFVIGLTLLAINCAYEPYSPVSSFQDKQLYTWGRFSPLVRQYLMDVSLQGRAVTKIEYRAMQRQYEAEVNLEKTTATT